MRILSQTQKFHLQEKEEGKKVAKNVKEDQKTEPYDFENGKQSSVS